jgi:predicted Zn-ribbon and HTH transcriptional regulator
MSNSCGEETEEGGRWVQGPAMCRLCGYRWRAVRPAEADEDCLECPNCGHMTGGPLLAEKGESNG